ncbi:Rer1 family-domain-containing protein [Gorgonomyces haynaldii]|nr:Rer1 family-domain-containing protein [Gorgonomyces haynaldii]
MQPEQPQTAPLLKRLEVRYQKALDDLTPYYRERWAGTIVLGILYTIRAFTAGGWYIVTYALGIYLLNAFLAFLTPKFDPAMEQMLEEEEEGPSLPTSSEQEFRPFIRRLPEFKFWFYSTRAFLIAGFCTLFEAFDLPVFWPILLMYFILLFFLTMKRQIAHMVKYKYVPWNAGKKVIWLTPVLQVIQTIHENKPSRSSLDLSVLCLAHILIIKCHPFLVQIVKHVMSREHVLSKM